MILSLFSARVFAAETDKDFTLDDGTGDSPQVILRDETGGGELTVQKKDAGEVDIINTEGPINLKENDEETPNFKQSLKRQWSITFQNIISIFRYWE